MKDAIGVIQKDAEKFLRENPDIEKALKVFGIAEQQYAAALSATRRAEIRITHSTNQDQQ